MQTFSREACPQPAPTEKKQTNKRVQYLGVVCELATPLKQGHITTMCIQNTSLVKWLLLSFLCYRPFPLLPDYVQPEVLLQQLVLMQFMYIIMGTKPNLRSLGYWS